MLRKFLSGVVLALSLGALGGCSLTRVLNVESTPPGATVYVDGVAAGTTPALAKATWPKDEIPVQVRVEKAGYEPVARNLTSAEAKKAGDPWNLKIDLETLALTEELVIESNVEKAAVSINGKAAGLTPLKVALNFTRADAHSKWSTFLIEVGKDRHRYKAPSGEFQAVFSANVAPGGEGRLFVKLEAVKFFTTTVRRFMVSGEGVGTSEELVLSQVGDIEKEPKASAVTQITDVIPQEPLVETRMSVAAGDDRVVYSLPVWKPGQESPMGANIWIQKGTAKTRLTDGEYFDLEPYITADGQYVYFSSNRSGKMCLWRIQTTGKGGLQQITDSPSSVVDYEPALSPDGKRLAFSSLRTGSQTPQIWFCNPDGSQPTQIRNGRSPAWSPDSGMLAYVAPDVTTKRDSIWIINADGGDPRRLDASVDANNRYPVWTPDGKSIVYASDKALNEEQKPNFDIWIMKIDGSGATQLTVNGSYDARPAVSPSGKYIFFVSNRGAQSERQDTLQIWRLAF